MVSLWHWDCIFKMSSGGVMPLISGLDCFAGSLPLAGS
jgi:hypothetical protein